MDPSWYLESVDCYLQDLRESEVRKWCRKEGLDFSVPAQLAFLIMCPKKCFEAVYHYVRQYELSPTWVPLIPRPSDPEDAWTELVEWRHPKINLNLLQLAIILCPNDFILWYLWQPAFLREADYLDTSGRLVNHPLHLILALRRLRCIISNKFLSMQNIRLELLVEERTVDLTAARVQRHPTKTTQPGFFVSLFQWLFFWDTEPENPLELFRTFGPVETNLATQPLTGSVLPLPKEASPEDVRMVLCTILSKLKEPQAPASTVELLWQVQSDLSSCGFSLKLLLELQLDVYSSCDDLYAEDAQLLLYQLCWAVNKEQRWNFTTEEDTGIDFISRPDIFYNKPYLEVCRFMPTEHLKQYILFERFQAENARWWSPIVSSQLEGAADAMERLLRERTLQDHCVLSILDAVNGDARKVWGLSQLPEPLKQLFPVPFQELHEKLKAKEQSQQSAD